MKILQLTINFSPNIGGLETHLDDLVEGLAERHHDVFVLSYKPLTTKTKWKFYENRRNIRVLRLPWPSGLFYKLLGSPALEFLYLLPGIFIATPLILLINRPDVIHAHGIVAGFVGSIWAKIFNKSLVISTHTVYNFPASGSFRNIAAFIFNQADKVLCLSADSMEEVSKLGVSPEKIDQFVNWVDVKRFKPSRKKLAKTSLGWDDTFTALFVGRLVPGKGVNEFLNASKHVGDNVQLAIAGNGPLSEEVESFAAQANNVKSIGTIQPSDAPVYFNAADVFVMASTHNEGFGRVTIEAMACGTPVIGSRRGETKAILGNGIGVLVDPSPKDIARGISQLANNPSRLAEYGVNSRQYVVDNFSDKHIETIIRAYTKSPTEEVEIAT